MLHQFWIWLTYSLSSSCLQMLDIGRRDSSVEVDYRLRSSPRHGHFLQVFQEWRPPGLLWSASCSSSSLAHSIHGYTFAAPCCGIFSTWPAIAQQWHIMCTLNRQMSSFFDGLRCQTFRFSSMLLSKSRSYDIWQETQLSLTNRATPLEVSQGQSKHCTIRYVRYRFILVCFSNFVREIFDFKYAVTSKTGLGVLSRSLKMSPFDRAHMTYYWRSIVNMALSRVIFEIFNVENIATLKSRSGVNQGYWKWYHSIDCI